MSLIRVSGSSFDSRADFVAFNLDQVVWAEVSQYGATSGVQQVNLRMVEGTTVTLHGVDAEFVVKGLRESLGEMPAQPGVPGAEGI